MLSIFIYGRRRSESATRASKMLSGVSSDAGDEDVRHVNLPTVIWIIHRKEDRKDSMAGQSYTVPNQSFHPSDGGS